MSPRKKRKGATKNGNKVDRIASQYNLAAAILNLISIALRIIERLIK